MTAAEKKGLVWLAVYGLLIFYSQRARKFGDVRAAAYHIAKDFFSRNELPPLWVREVLLMEKCPRNWGRDMAIVLTVAYVCYFCEVCLFCELPPTRTRLARGDQESGCSIVKGAMDLLKITNISESALNKIYEQQNKLGGRPIVESFARSYVKRLYAIFEEIRLSE
jgi:hypothetical protein